MEDLIINKLKENGRLVSPQRKIIISELCRAGEIRDVEHFWIDLRSRHAISWATVHSNLRLLIRMGVVCRSQRGVSVSVHLAENLTDMVET